MRKNEILENMLPESPFLSETTPPKKWQVPELIEVDYSETQAGLGGESGGDGDTGYS
ncbi:MAG: hypothetical protein GX155_05000 [Smithella sp.]|jgi:hypothetical protein|nr:hypothetical protein [Smithella sp.]